MSTAVTHTHLLWLWTLGTRKGVYPLHCLPLKLARLLANCQHQEHFFCFAFSCYWALRKCPLKIHCGWIHWNATKLLKLRKSNHRVITSSCMLTIIRTSSRSARGKSNPRRPEDQPASMSSKSSIKDIWDQHETLIKTLIKHYTSQLPLTYKTINFNYPSAPYHRNSTFMMRRWTESRTTYVSSASPWRRGRTWRSCKLRNPPNSKPKPKTSNSSHTLDPPSEYTLQRL